MEEEIDLRPYIRALFRAWYWIVAAAVVTAVVAYLVSASLPESYEAEAVVAIVRERTTVSFNTSIETQEDVLGSRDLRSRLDALVALVKSNDVAEKVLAEVETDLVANKRNVPELLKMVQAGNTGDLIIITVSHQDPVVAAKIANVWAQVYEQLVNTLYVSGTSVRLDVLEAQVQDAKTAYEKAQTELEAFIGDNQIEALENEINVTEVLLSTYLSATTTIQTAPIQFQAAVREELLANYYADLGNIELWLADAQALRQQVASGAGSTAANVGNALALIELRSRIFGGGDGTVILQLDLANELQEPVRVQDMDAVIAVLEARRAETRANIESFSTTFAAVAPVEGVVDDTLPLQQHIADLDAELLRLRSEVAAQTAQLEELNRSRNLAWNTYRALAEKEDEVTVAADSTGTEVRLASKSAVPDEPAGRNSLLMAVVAAVVGGMVAVFGITAVFWWREAGNDGVDD